MPVYSRKQQRQSSGGGCCGCSPCCIFLILILAVGGILVYLGQTGELDWWPEEGFNFPSLEDFIEENPYNASTPEESPRWPNSGRGLDGLEILFAAEEKWLPYFDQAVLEWDNPPSGNPDSLTLTTKTIARDLECKPIDGKMKFCNDDYGETGWRGINVAILFDNTIANSVAKMNEYNLSRAGEAEKQYTACHEIGHGFGLPHTDETFWNRPQGNCMDYTNNFEANMQPDTVNYEFLADMYGTINGGTSVAEQSAVEEDEAKTNLRAGDGRRRLRQIPRRVQKAHDALMKQLEQTNPSRRLSSKKVRIDLEDGWSIRVEFLWAP